MGVRDRVDVARSLSPHPTPLRNLRSLALPTAIQQCGTLTPAREVCLQPAPIEATEGREPPVGSE